jgi:hypothetical protein
MVGTLYGNSKTRPFPHLAYRYRSRVLTVQPFWSADQCLLLAQSGHG